MSRIVLLLVGCFAATLALADEAKIRRVVEDKLGVRVEGVMPAPVAGLFEVRFRVREGYRIVYSDADASLIVIGSIYDTKKERNLTEERVRKLSAIDFRKLPLDLAVKIQRGNGKRVLAMFSDPYCPACRQFEQVLRNIDNITVHVFMFPVIRPENADHSRAVWCSEDRVKAWFELAVADVPKVPAASPNCPNPVDKVLALGQSLGVSATPTLFFVNGERTSGGLPAERLVPMLDEIAAAQAKVK